MPEMKTDRDRVKRDYRREGTEGLGQRCSEASAASTQPTMAALWFLMGHDLREKLQQSAAKNDRFLIDEIEYRLTRDFEHEALGPRRSVRIRAKRRIAGAGKRRKHLNGLTAA